MVDPSDIKRLRDEIERILQEAQSRSLFLIEARCYRALVAIDNLLRDAQ